MVELVVKQIDRRGRASIPVQWRRGWKSRKLALIGRGDRIEPLPLNPPPSGLYDSIRIPENVDFTDTHSIKKALLKPQRSSGSGTQTTPAPSTLRLTDQEPRIEEGTYLNTIP